MPKNAKNYNCEICLFKCSKKSNYEKHLLTRKHLFRTTLNKKGAKNAVLFECQYCAKTYTSRNGLWYHSSKCNSTIHSLNNDIYSEDIITVDTVEQDTLKITNKLNIYKNNSSNRISKNKCINTNVNTNCNKNSDDGSSNNDIISYLMKENQELKHMVIDVCKNTNTIINNTNNINNINNKTFNLNLFLNEECKDAMNIKDFVESVQLQLSDLENVGKVGFVNGISNIIIKNLQALEINKRPVHCSDFKRETMYIKDENKWEKENEQKERLRKVIREIANKNTRLLSEYKNKYPQSKNVHSRKANEFDELLIESLGGKCNSDIDNQDKILKKIAREVYLEK